VTSWPAQRRTVTVLALAQVLGGIAVAAGVAVNALVAQTLADSVSLSGLAQTMGVLGGAAAAVPLTVLAQKHGRRPALALGYLLAAAGAGLSILAAILGSYPVLLLGAGIFGVGSSTGSQARFAAIDRADGAHRAGSLSVVVWATTIGSVLGPNLSDPGAWVGSRAGVPALAGPYLFSVAGFLAAALVLWVWLRPDPLAGSTVAQAPGGFAAPIPRRVPTHTALTRAVRRPASLLALTSIAVAHAVMVSVMVMTPVQLHEHGATLKIIGLVISLHIAGMYALSPVFGWLADRIGRPVVIVLGWWLLGSALLLAGTADPMDHGRASLALILLGLGWSACLVAGSTLLAESTPSAEVIPVQGGSDLVMGVTAAVAGALAGPVMGAGGYGWLTITASLLFAPLIAGLVRYWLSVRAGRGRAGRGRADHSAQ
jgi:MFS family permease